MSSVRIISRVYSHHDAKGEDTIVRGRTKPFAYARINNTERGLTQYDVFDTNRVVTCNR